MQPTNASVPQASTSTHPIDGPAQPNPEPVQPKAQAPKPTNQKNVREFKTVVLPNGKMFCLENYKSGCGNKPMNSRAAEASSGLKKPSLSFVRPLLSSQPTLRRPRALKTAIVKPRSFQQTERAVLKNLANSMAQLPSGRPVSQRLILHNNGVYNVQQEVPVQPKKYVSLGGKSQKNVNVIEKTASGSEDGSQNPIEQAQILINESKNPISDLGGPNNPIDLDDSPYKPEIQNHPQQNQRYQNAPPMNYAHNQFSGPPNYHPQHQIHHGYPQNYGFHQQPHMNHHYAQHQPVVYENGQYYQYITNHQNFHQYYQNPQMHYAGDQQYQQHPPMNHQQHYGHYPQNPSMNQNGLQNPPIHPAGAPTPPMSQNGTQNPLMPCIGPQNPQTNLSAPSPSMKQPSPPMAPQPSPPVEQTGQMSPLLNPSEQSSRPPSLLNSSMSSPSPQIPAIDTLMNVPSIKNEPTGPLINAPSPQISSTGHLTNAPSPQNLSNGPVFSPSMIPPTNPGRQMIPPNQQGLLMNPPAQFRHPNHPSAPQHGLSMNPPTHQIQQMIPPTQYGHPNQRYWPQIHQQQHQPILYNSHIPNTGQLIHKGPPMTGPAHQQVPVHQQQQRMPQAMNAPVPIQYVKGSYQHNKINGQSLRENFRRNECPTKFNGALQVQYQQVPQQLVQHQQILQQHVQQQLEVVTIDSVSASSHPSTDSSMKARKMLMKPAELLMNQPDFLIKSSESTNSTAPILASMLSSSSDVQMQNPNPQNPPTSSTQVPISDEIDKEPSDKDIEKKIQEMEKSKEELEKELAKQAEEERINQELAAMNPANYKKDEEEPIEVDENNPYGLSKEFLEILKEDEESARFMSEFWEFEM